MAKVALINLTEDNKGIVIGFTTDVEENQLPLPRYNNTTGTKAIIIEQLKGFNTEKAEEIKLNDIYNNDCIYPG